MNRLKELRLNNNKTQKDIADYLGLTRQAIAYYEKGKRTPKPETWQALADFFNVSVPYLQGKISYKALDPLERGLYDHVTVAMDRAFYGYAFLPERKERVLKAIAYSIDNGEFN